MNVMPDRRGYVPLEKLLEEVREHCSVGDEGAGFLIRDGHVLRDLVLKYLHPNGRWGDLHWRFWEDHPSQKETWFHSGILELPFEVRSRRRVKPIEWVRCRIYATPESRNRFLEMYTEAMSRLPGPAPESATQVSTAEAEVMPLPKKRGPSPTKTNQVAQAMRDDITSRKETRKTLEDMTQEAMAATYHASRETVCAARDMVLSEPDVSAPSETPTKADKTPTVGENNSDKTPTVGKITPTNADTK